MVLRGLSELSYFYFKISPTLTPPLVLTLTVAYTLYLLGVFI